MFNINGGRKPLRPKGRTAREAGKLSAQQSLNSRVSRIPEDVIKPRVRHLGEGRVGARRRGYLVDAFCVPGTPALPCGAGKRGSEECHLTVVSGCLRKAVMARGSGGGIVRRSMLADRTGSSSQPAESALAVVVAIRLRLVHSTREYVLLLSRSWSHRARVS